MERRIFVAYEHLRGSVEGWGLANGDVPLVVQGASKKDHNSKALPTRSSAGSRIAFRGIVNHELTFPTHFSWRLKQKIRLIAVLAELTVHFILLLFWVRIGSYGTTSSDN
jgi:hypothetical protein